MADAKHTPVYGPVFDSTGKLMASVARLREPTLSELEGRLDLLQRMRRATIAAGNHPTHTEAEIAKVRAAIAKATGAANHG